MPATVNVRGLLFVVPDSMLSVGEESDDKTHAYRRALLLKGHLKDRTLVEMTAIEDMPGHPCKNFEAAKASHDRIGDRTFPVPGGSSSMRQRPLSSDTYNNRGPPLASV